MPTFRSPTGLFNPPVLESERRLNPLAYRLRRHYGGQPVGRTVLKEAGVWSTVDTPSSDRVAAAQVVFLGGHDYVVDDAMAAELTAAGYGANLS